MWVKRRRAGLIVERLERLVADAQPVRTPASLLRRETASWLDTVDRWTADFPGAATLKALLLESGLEKHAASLAAIEALLVVATLAGVLIFGVDVWLASGVAVVLAITPLMILKGKADSRRAKLSEQLPDAIDLMVAVLRSGHSVPEAVRAVAAEIPNPCGEEFKEVMQRMNLGQSLSEALVSSARRFRSFELDLIRRAVAIQTEVGGSLAELFDATNVTLRGRLKLARQLKTITAQSRLSAYIVGFLPIVLAIALNSLSPGYMQILFDDQTGRTLLIVAITLQCLGLLIMRRMSSVRS
jgi:tight adherence protein B